MSDFDREIELELYRALDSIDAVPIPIRRTAQSRATRARALLGGAGAALAVKLVSGVAVAAAAVTVAGATTTGSLDPSVWGQQVTQRVQQCKDTLADGKHGIGDCVSAFAKTHGQGVASDARQHGNGSDNPNAHGGNPNANDHAKDKTRSNPSSTKSQGSGRPTELPAGGPPVTVTPRR